MTPQTEALTPEPETKEVQDAQGGCLQQACSALVWRYDPASVPKNALQECDRQPCPFCGAQATGLTHKNKHVVVMCGNCYAYGPELLDEVADWNENDFRAIMLWNHRGTWQQEPNAKLRDAGESGVE